MTTRTFSRDAVILDESRLREAVAYFSSQDGFAFDVESQGEHRGVCHLNDVTWMSLATKGACIVIPFGHPIGSKVVGTRKEPHVYATGAKAGQTFNRNIKVYEDAPKQLDRELVFDILRPLFFWRKRKRVSAHGAVFDLASTAKYFGEVIPPPYNDTIIQSWLLNENRHKHNLKLLTHDHFGFYYDDEEVGRCIESHPFDKVAYYSFCDARYCWLLDRLFTPQVEDQQLMPVYDLEMRILSVMVGMRLAGAHVDVARLKELKDELAVLRDKQRAELMQIAGREFNPNSPKDKQDILFGQLGLKPGKMTESGRKAKREHRELDGFVGYSTDDEVLEDLEMHHPLVPVLREFGDTQKLLSTYVMAYLGDGEDKPCQIYDDRIYADFVQYGTTTRRFSCRAPNLQNIPRSDTENGKRIRGVWLADEGWKLIVGDYSQIELVMFAHFAEPGALRQAFIDGADVHQMTGDKLGISRQFGKTMNFSMGFGATEYLLARKLNVDLRTAKHLLADHQRAFPELYALKRKIIAQARRREPVPFVRTLLGGMRRLPDINSGTDWIAGRAERQAVSSVIQGSAADLIKLAMVRADSDPRLGGDIHMVLTVHDEIMMTAPEDQASLAADILRDAMIGEGIQRLINVPMKIDLKIVDRWSEAK